MVKKKKASTIENVSQVAQQAGIVLMTAAVTLGMVELSEHGPKVVLPNQPAMAFAGENEGQNPIRREKEETGPHYVSYSTYQRTPGRTGRV